MWQRMNLCDTKQYYNTIEFLMLSFFRAAVEIAETWVANKGMQRTTVWDTKSFYRCTGTDLWTAVLIWMLKCSCSAGSFQPRHRFHSTLCYYSVQEGFLNWTSFPEDIFIFSIMPLKAKNKSPGYIYFFQWTNNVYIYNFTILPVTNGTQIWEDLQPRVCKLNTNIYFSLIHSS